MTISRRSLMALPAAAWAQQYSLSGLREALRQLLTERWKSADGTGPGLEPAPGNQG